MSASQMFANKVAIITGASSGIGAATAQLFAKRGAQLCLSGRNSESLSKVAEACVVSGAKVHTVNADLTDEKQITNIVNETLKKFKGIHILVNNAGIMEMGSIEQTSLEQYDKLMNTNLRSIYQLCMLSVPHLIASQGCIVNVSSVTGKRSFPGVLAYNISKAAVDSLTECMALELASKKVRVNAVNPGVIVTELQRRAGLDDSQYKTFLERSCTTHALGRPGQPHEVANAIAFLSSDEASFITGETLPVDGGRHAMCPR